MSQKSEDKEKGSDSLVESEEIIEPGPSNDVESTKQLPSHPLPRDVCLGDNNHKGTMLLNDLIRVNYVLLKGGKDGGGKVYKTPAEASTLASRLTTLMRQGKKFQLSGFKDVPEPFLVGEGRFFEKSGDTWLEKTETEAEDLVAQAIIEQFEAMEASGYLTTELEELVATLTRNCDPSSKEPDDPASSSAPRPCDVFFVLIDCDLDEILPHEQQSGNKHLLYLASLGVTGCASEVEKRVEAFLKIVTSKIEVNSGTEMITKTPRYVVQDITEGSTLNTWREFERDELAEAACVFTFEVFLEKQRLGFHLPTSLHVAASEMVKASDAPVEDPTPEDVLFGRGGMTNGHPGNRRFRDIIALHRPDYIRASKMDKPNVARRLVRAFRQGNPPRRFLKKHDDGKWYDVGDRSAAEKTSQGLRERSNAEKRQRSAIREALKIRKVDLADRVGDKPPPKKAKVVDPSPTLFYTSAVPLSLSMKDDSKPQPMLKKTDLDSESEDPLPPNAVDKDGNILVTDYDILCGRGGLTNHHRGNKRFRDIVALHRPDYVRAPKVQKPSVARVIVRAIRNGDPPGRFLRKDEKTGQWVDIGDRKAAEKTSQALREKPDDEEKGIAEGVAEIAPKPSEDDDGEDDNEGKKPAVKKEDTKSTPLAIEV